ncbi:uncharacterized protein ASCRUDRAFT_19942, partial [Ascoidea rubescens DSM 1968]
AFPIPDLRFEHSFRNALNKYAAAEAAKKAKIQKQNLSLQAADNIEPIPVITPSIILYAIVKDQMLMPLVQGFAMAMLLLSVKPWLVAITNHGKKWGISVKNL